jgi:broad specificity phosphatase PhoE
VQRRRKELQLALRPKHPPVRGRISTAGRTSARTPTWQCASFWCGTDGRRSRPALALPPEELQDLVGELTAVFTSDKPRSQDSARALAPNAELIADPLFEEAPLASPRIPLLRMGVPSWAVMARILWHAGYHPEIENYRRAKHRAVKAADILMARAREDGLAVLVAHGYFNAIIGRELRRRDFNKTGSHRVRFWNAVIYELT